MPSRLSAAPLSTDAARTADALSQGVFSATQVPMSFELKMTPAP